MQRDHELGALGLLGVGAAIPLLRVLPQPTHVLPGSALGDVYKHAWSYWHLLAQVEAGGWPWTEFLNAPGGGRLLDVMLAPAILMAPFCAALGAIATANLFVWGSLFGVAAATWALARELTESRAGAVLAGLLATWSPYLAGYPLFSGVHERLAIWIFPVVILASIRVARSGSARWGAAACVAMAMVGLSCAVYGLWSLLLFGGAAGVLLGPPQTRGLRARRLVVLGIGFLVVLGAAFFLARGITHDPWSLSPQPGRMSLGLGVGPQAMDVATLGEMFWPWTAASQQPVDSGDALLQITYLGWVLGGIGLLGALRARGAQAHLLRWTVGFGFLAALVAMGPSVGSMGLPNLPYLLLAWTIPLFGRIPVPFQLVGIATPLLAIGVASWVGSGPSQLKRALVILVLALVERSVAVPVGLVQPVADARVASVYEGIGEGPVVEIPRQYQGRFLASGQVFLAQTAHRQPIPVSVHLGVTEWDAFEPVLRGQAEDWTRAFSCLRKGGFRWLVVHRNHYPDAQLAQSAIAGMGQALAPNFDDGADLLFDLSGLTVSAADKTKLPPFSPQPLESEGPIHPAATPDEQGEEFARVRPGCPVH